MKYVLFARVSGFNGKDYEKGIEAEALPQPEQRLVFDTHAGGTRPKVANVYHPVFEKALPIVTVQLYGRADDRDWHEILESLGFTEASRVTINVIDFTGGER